MIKTDPSQSYFQRKHLGFNIHSYLTVSGHEKRQYRSIENLKVESLKMSQTTVKKHMLSYKQHFYKQRQLKLEKNQVNAKEHSEAEFFLHGNNSHSSSRLYSIRLIIVKTKMKMKSRSHKYDINRPSPDMRTNIANIKSVSV